MVSIIIVNYKVKEKVINCLESIQKNIKDLSYEVIVVDNEGNRLLERDLKKYQKVKYVKPKINLGFGAGNNFGAKFAKGKYLFFLNPDTVIEENAIRVLHDFFEKDSNAGIVSPLIIKSDGKPLNRQGYKELNLINGIFTFSFLRKRFPRLSVSSYYSLKDWGETPIRKVDTVYGAALMIPAEIFKTVGGFDEDFFLYFEENDLSKRVRKLGFELFINSNARVIHEVGQSTKQFAKRDEYFARSRSLYFRKHFGLFQAMILEAVLKIRKAHILLVLAIISGLILRLMNLDKGMPFIGDQGWFYISARDMLINGKIPLVGITSSHLWLHQGPLWTYMLASVLPFFSFNPLSGAYLTIFTGLLSILFIYKLGKEMFSIKTGIIAAFLYSVSPAIIVWDRTPFDPSPIPLFSILYFYSLYKWVAGDKKFFPLILLFIAILYNLELATFSLFFPFIIIFIYGFIRKKLWFNNIKNKQILAYSLIAFSIPMLPIFIYDIFNGFKQTVVFGGWVIYKPFSALLHSGGTSFDFANIIGFLSTSIANLILPQGLIIAVIIFVSGLIFLIIQLLKTPQTQHYLLSLFILFGLGGILINQTPSSAYLPIIFPFVILITAILFDFFTVRSKIFYPILILVLIFNVFSSLNNDQITNLSDRIKAADEIIALTGRQSYNLIGKGSASQFKSFTMNYEYLLWWKGYPVSYLPQKTKVIIEERDGKIILSKKIL